MRKMVKKEASLGSLVDGMIKVIDDTRRSATKVPVDTSSFITMAFYLGELRDVLTHLNTKQPQSMSFADQNPDAFNGLQRLKGTLQKLQAMTYRAAHLSSRLFLILDTAKSMGDLQTAVQEVGHDLNLVPVLSLMSSFLPSDVSDKLADLRSRMRSATFDSEPEILDLCQKLDDAVLQRSKEQATEALAGVLRHFGASSNVGGSGSAGSAEVQSLSDEVQRDLEAAEADQRWTEVEKLMDIKAFLGLASLSQEAPIVQATSRLALRLQETEADLAVPSDFKCSLSGETMRDPVIVVETDYTYDRSAIEAWFAKGKRSCPTTGKFLRSVELVPNSSLRKAIEESYDRLNERTLQEAVRLVRECQGCPEVLQAGSCRPAAGSSAALQAAEARPAAASETGAALGAVGATEGAGGGGVDVVEGARGGEQMEARRCPETNRSIPQAAALRAGADVAQMTAREQLDEAIEALLQLTGVDQQFGQKTLQLGAVPSLVDLISPDTGLHEGDPLRGTILAVLCNVAKTGEEAVLAMVDAGVVGSLVKMLAADGADVAAAVRLMRELSQVAVARQAIIEELGVVEAIKLLNKHPEPSDELGTEIAGVLEVYWRDDPYVAIQMASVGMFKPLIQLLGPGNDVETRLMMADGVMQWGVNKATRVTLVQEGVLPPLVDLLSNGPVEARAAAARSIEHLSHTDINRVALAKAGVIPALVKALAKGGPQLKAAAQATLANLAMDDQDLDSLDEEGTAVRLITMLRTGQQTNRDYAIRTLECMARESKSIKAALMEDDGAVPAVFDVLKEGPGHGFTAGSLRSTALLLLSHLCYEPGASDIMVAQPEVVKALAVLLNRPIPQDEREAVAVLLATMAGNKRMCSLLRAEEHVYLLMQKLLTSSAPRVQEKMMSGFAHIADPADADPQQVLEAQQAIARLGLVPVAVKYLKLGPDIMRIPSTLLLGNLALSTPSLSTLASNDRKQGRSKAWAKLGFTRSGSMSTSSSSAHSASPSSSPGSKDKLRSCKVHSGRCSLESTFCLVEGDLVGVLLELAKRGEDRVAEVSLMAVASLLVDEDDQEKAADYLVKLEVVEVAAGLVGRTKALTKWAVYILERIFHFKRFRSEKIAQPAITSLGRYMTTATGPERKMAADTIMKLNILPKTPLDGEQ